MVFDVCLAEKLIRINCIYEKTYYMCLNYLVKEEITPDIIIQTTVSDIQKEKTIFKNNNEYKSGNESEYGDNYFEFIAVYRKIVDELIHYDTILMHGSVISSDGAGYLFTAPSGVGKTTHSRLWIKNFPDTFIVNGDKPLIQVNDTLAYAFGTPWAGKEGYKKNCKVPLKAICFINRGTENFIKEISFKEAFIGLYKQIYMFSDPENAKRSLELIEKLSKSVRFYKLYCNMDNEAAIIAHDFMKDN